jgi:hypothetical protein
MGLLDDAIREHLELKRRRGADATEISREESAALGPVRRSPEGVPDLSDLPPLDAAEGAEPVAPEAPVPGEGATGLHMPPEAEIAEPPPLPLPPAGSTPVPEPAVFEPPPVPAAPPPVPAPPFADEPPAAAEEPPAEAPAEEPEHHSLLSRLNPASRLRHSRHEADSEPAEPPAVHEPPDEPEIVPADDEPEGEELLEETPDFLEETPEHDRLWFEQRPPRDFNFDE